jgi:hypothetical protein
MQPARAEGGPLRRHGDGILGEHRLGVGAPLAQADTAPILQIDGGDDDHAASFTMAAKFSSMTRPQRWLFSGWNCVAWMRPSSTAAAKHTP